MTAPKTVLKFFKTNPLAVVPKFGTKESACFDLAYQPVYNGTVKGFNANNAPIERKINPSGTFTIMPGDRLLVPVGFILDIPQGFSVRFHARSGLSLKNGLILANNEAVIDSDYVEEIFIMLTNISSLGQDIQPGNRLAQGELVKTVSYTLGEARDKPGQKTDRVGGYGSTGV